MVPAGRLHSAKTPPTHTAPGAPTWLAWLRLLHAHPRAVLLATLMLAVVALAAAASLQLNANQLDLLPADHPTVREARRVAAIAGTGGFLMVALELRHQHAGDEWIRAAALATLRGEKDRARRLSRRAAAAYRARPPPKGEEALLRSTAARLAGEIAKLPDVATVRYRGPSDFFRRNLPLYLPPKALARALQQIGREIEDRAARASPFYIDLGAAPPFVADLRGLLSDVPADTRLPRRDVLLSADGRMLLIFVKPTFPVSDIERASRLYDRVRSLTAGEAGDSAVTARLAGSYAYYVEAHRSIRASLQPALLAAAVLILLILAVSVRSPWAIAALIANLTLGVLLCFAVTAVVLGRLNAVTAMFGGVLAGLGIDFGIHMVHAQARRRRRDAADGRESGPLETALDLAPAVLISATTTAAAFAVLTLSDFGALSELGWMAGYGILLVALCTLIVLPVLLAPRMRPALPARPEPTDGLGSLSPSRDKPTASPPEFPAHTGPRRRLPGEPALFACAGLLLVLGAALGLPRLGLEEDVRNILETRLDSVRLSREIDVRFGISGDPLVIATDSEAEARRTWSRLNPLPEEMRATFTRADSLFRFLPADDAQATNLRLLAAFRARHAGALGALERSSPSPRVAQVLRWLRLRPIRVADLPATLRARFRGVGEGAFEGRLIFLYPRMDQLYRTQDIQTLARLSERYGAVGSTSLAAVLVNLMRRELPWLLGLSVSGVFLVLWIWLRRMRDVVLCLLPVLAGGALLGGLMGLLGERINLFNAAVLPVLLGYGIDSAIFLYARVQRGLSGWAALSETGPAILTSGLTSIAGWGSLILADHPGIRSMGLVAALGVASLLVVTVTIFPWILDRWSDPQRD